MISSQGFQELTAKGEVIRFAYCPDHQKRSSVWRGEQPQLDGIAVYWVFKCKQGHLFMAQPDRNSPRSQPEYDAWIKSQLELRLEKMTKKQTKGKSLA